jgi:hypothetical protein
MARQDFMSGVFNFSIDTETYETEENQYKWDPFSLDDPYAVPHLETTHRTEVRPGDIFRYSQNDNSLQPSIRQIKDYPSHHGKLNWKL